MQTSFIFTLTFKCIIGYSVHLSEPRFAHAIYQSVSLTHLEVVDLLLTDRALVWQMGRRGPEVIIDLKRLKGPRPSRQRILPSL